MVSHLPMLACLLGSEERCSCVCVCVCVCLAWVCGRVFSPCGLARSSDHGRAELPWVLQPNYICMPLSRSIPPSPQTRIQAYQHHPCADVLRRGCLEAALSACQGPSCETKYSRRAVALKARGESRQPSTSVVRWEEQNTPLHGGKSKHAPLPAMTRQLSKSLLRNDISIMEGAIRTPKI